ncbi:MAG: molybdopterin molybdotransferase MoeA [Pusillimonas sp.]|nr:molybdopterin molybdotransferase MoeA [Pusillimonas sp.]
MLDFDTAQELLAQAATAPTQKEICSLKDAQGRVLASNLQAQVDLPPADNSAMDGYAIRLSDYEAGKALPVQQRCFAGETPEPLKPGHTIRLFTGSLMPKGADTVVMQEDTTEADNAITINTLPTAGAHVRKKGEDVEKEQDLLQRGTVLGPAQIGLLASQGINQVEVWTRLKVGILTTGDELVSPGQALGPAQLYNSNGAMLAALVSKLGAAVVHQLHATDTHESIESAFKTLLQDCDLVLTVGGVSVGEKDLVKPTIELLGGKLDLWKVAMKPGKPVALAKARGTPIVCLPGNPVSAFVVCTLLVSAMIRAMQGRSEPHPRVMYGHLRSHRQFNETREEFLRVQTKSNTNGELSLVPYELQGSAIISSLPWASGLARIPANTVVKDDDIVRYYAFADWLV